MPTPWKIPTKLDALRAAGELAPDAPPPDGACGCGRTRPADMLLNLRALPPGLRAHFPPDQDFACDACRHLLELRGVLRASELVAGLGAPAALVARLRRQDPDR